LKIDKTSPDNPLALGKGKPGCGEIPKCPTGLPKPCE